MDGAKIVNKIHIAIVYPIFHIHEMFVPLLRYNVSEVINVPKETG